MKKTSLAIPGGRLLHIAARGFILALLLWESHQTQASILGQPIEQTLPIIIASAHCLLGISILLFFWSYTSTEPILLFLDLLTATCLLVLYQGDFSFSAPLYLATYTAGSMSLGAAMSAAFIGSGLFLLLNIYFQGPLTAFLGHPSWLFVLVLNLLLSSTGFYKSEIDQQQAKADSLVSLIEAGQELGSSLTYDRLFDLTSTMAKSLFSASTCALYLREDESLKLHRVDSPYFKLFHDFDPKVSKSVLSEVLKEKLPKYFDDVNLLPESEEQILPRAKHLRAGMAVPLVFENEVIGLLFVAGNLTRMYNNEQLKLFTVLANQTAVSLRNVQLHEKTATMAITDSVSGLYTHGYMQDVLEKEFHRCKYGNLPLSTIILDVDHFKIVNDTYGHPQGDALLRQLGAVIKTVTRISDTVCRYGGDEFLIILPETNRIGAVLVAERIRQAVEEYEFVLGSKIVKIQISGGVASFPEDIQTKKEMVEKSDQALYEAKKQGRNKICFGS